MIFLLNSLEGCNSSFIALIPKTQEAKMVKDFHPISLIGSMYKIIAKILANRLSLVILDLVSDFQSAFVSKRQIFDGPFILNELFSWCKRKNTKVVIFKVDFEKAFDSVRWDFLDEVLHKFRFGDKCLYKGIHLNDSLSPSHLFYADDVVFVGFPNGNSTLSVAGRYTLTKSVLSSLHLHYFSIFKVPKGILNKMESFRMNFFNGVDIADRKMSLIGWKNILASMKNEGLGISSLFALNGALLFKWIWHFITNGSSLWSRFIKAIYGNRGAIDIIHNTSRCSYWLDIIREFKSLSSTSIDLFSLVKKVGNGEETSFWDEV
nr:RNA-directed DNA polymerase, eukaryota [Tanacetum cinerariifolium]